MLFGQDLTWAFWIFTPRLEPVYLFPSLGAVHLFAPDWSEALTHCTLVSCCQALALFVCSWIWMKTSRVGGGGGEILVMSLVLGWVDSWAALATCSRSMLSRGLFSALQVDTKYPFLTISFSLWMPVFCECTHCKTIIVNDNYLILKRLRLPIINHLIAVRGLENAFIMPFRDDLYFFTPLLYRYPTILWHFYGECSFFLQISELLKGMTPKHLTVDEIRTTHKSNEHTFALSL